MDDPTINGLPMIQLPPLEILKAARDVMRWAEQNYGYGDWQINGLGPVPSYCRHVRCLLCKPQK